MPCHNCSIHTYVCTHIHAYIHTYIHIHTCIHTYIHTHIHTYIHTHACIHTYIHTYTHTDIHACIHTCMHTYVHTYMHTYMHTYIGTVSMYFTKCLPHCQNVGHSSISLSILSGHSDKPTCPKCHPVECMVPPLAFESIGVKLVQGLLHPADIWHAHQRGKELWCCPKQWSHGRGDMAGIYLIIIYK